MEVAFATPVFFGYRRNIQTRRNLQASSSRAFATVNKEFPFPRGYSELLKQAQTATQTALDDSKKLLEVEIPPSGLDSVSGDGDGGSEMNASMNLVRGFCQGIFGGEKSSRTRIMELAKRGVFEGTSFKLDYLTKPTIWDDIGLSQKLKMADRPKATDSVFVVAYPYFNANEMLAVEELYRESAMQSSCPMILFNADIEKIRSGYHIEDYPSFFYPKLGALAKSFIPLFETVYYIHNFKGMKGGSLFRVYPGPWQVLRKVRDEMVCVHSQQTMPSLKQVALEILPSV